MNVQLLRMPCQVYSGVKPPDALLEAMSDRPTEVPPPMPARPGTQTGGITGPPAPGGPTQTTDHIEPSPEDIPPDAPPSYEDAIADSIGPIDGPRREYQQSQPPAGANEKSQRLFDDHAH